VGWNPESLYVMLGEMARKGLEDPSYRAFNRRLLSPGFTKEALGGYLDKVCLRMRMRSAVCGAGGGWLCMPCTGTL
jgi:cytochrome P450